MKGARSAATIERLRRELVEERSRSAALADRLRFVESQRNKLVEAASLSREAFEMMTAYAGRREIVAALSSAISGSVDADVVDTLAARVDVLTSVSGRPLAHAETSNGTSWVRPSKASPSDGGGS